MRYQYYYGQPGSFWQVDIDMTYDAICWRSMCFHQTSTCAALDMGVPANQEWTACSFPAASHLHLPQVRPLLFPISHHSLAHAHEHGCNAAMTREHHITHEAFIFAALPINEALHLQALRTPSLCLAWAKHSRVWLPCCAAVCSKLLRLTSP